MSLTDLTTTRLPNGLSTVNPGVLTDSLKYPDPLLYQEWLDDFIDFVPTAWTVTETQAGAAQATTAGAGGLLLLTNTAANNDVNQVQKAAASFLPVAGKRTYMRTRFKVDDASLSQVAIGFATVSADATVLANSLDGIFLRKPGGTTDLTLYVRQDNTTGSTSVVVATLVTDTYIEIGVCYDGGDRVYYEVNGSVVGYITVSSAVLPNAAGAPVIAVKNGSGVIRILTADYLWISQER